MLRMNVSLHSVAFRGQNYLKNLSTNGNMQKCRERFWSTFTHPFCIDNFAEFDKGIRMIVASTLCRALQTTAKIFMDVSLPKIILRIHVAKTVQSPIFIGSEIRTHSVTQMRQACLPLCRHIYTTSVKVDLISFNPFIGRKRKRGEKL